jgi:hypothetical protein
VSFPELELVMGLQLTRECRYVNFTTQERQYKASFFEYVNAFKVYQDQGNSGNYSMGSS